MATRSEALRPAGVPAGPTPIKAIPVRHYGRWISAVVVIVVLGGLLWSIAKNRNFHWAGVVGPYLFKGFVLRGVATTLELTVLAMLIGTFGGILLAVMRLSKNPVLTTISWLYIWFFRGTPQLVQIIFWGYLGSIYHQVLLGVPFTHVTWYSTQTSSIIGGFVAGMLGLGLNEAAYASEIVRAGILSVDEGQTEAAHALGLSNGQTMRRIVLPQAMRVIIPPMGNETISMLKTSALVSVISGHDLLTNIEDVYSQNFQVIPLLVVASLWYLALTSVFSIGQYFLERRFGRGTRRTAPPSVLARLLGFRASGGRA
jgi:polar amino acid transport system permease protein